MIQPATVATDSDDLHPLAASFADDDPRQLPRRSALRSQLHLARAQRRLRRDAAVHAGSSRP